MKKALVVLLVLLLVVAAAGVGGFFWVQKKAHQVALDLISRIPGVEKAEIGKTFYNPITQAATLDAVVITPKKGGPEKVTIDQIEVQKLNLARVSHHDTLLNGQGGESIAEFFSLTGIAATDPMVDVTLGELTAEDINLAATGVDPATPADQIFSPQNFPKILAAFSTKSIKLGPFGVKEKKTNTVLGALTLVQFTDLAGGRVGGFELAGLSVHPPVPSPQVDLKSFKAAGLDLTKVLAMASQGPMAPVGQGDLLKIDSLDLADFHVVDPKFDLTLARYTITGFQWAVPEVDPKTPIMELFNEKMMPKTMLAMAVAGTRMEKLTAKDPKANKTIISVDLAEVGAMKKGRVESYQIQNIELNPPDQPGQVKIKSAVAKGIEMGKMLEIAGSGKPPTFSMGETLKYESIVVTGIDVTAPDNQKVSVAEFSLANVRLIGPIPVSMVVDLKGLAMDVTKLPDPKSRETFKALGYDKLVMSANVDYAWDQASKAAVFKNISMGIDQGAVLQLSLALDGVDFSQIEQPADAMALMGAVALKRAQIRYQDQSLAGRILKMAAAMQGMQAEDLQTALAAQLEMMAGSMLDDSPDSEKLVEALQTFIKDPKSLTITSEPQPALPVMTLITEAKLSPDQLVKDLKLSLAVNDQAAVKVDKLGPSSGAEGGMPMPMPGTGQAPEAAKKPGTQPQPMPAPGGSSSFSDFFKKGAGTQPGKDGSLEAQPLKKK